MDKLMSAYDAIAILDGFYDGQVTRELYLEACRRIRDHGPRGVAHGSGTRNAIELADLADKIGDDEALDQFFGG